MNGFGLREHITQWWFCFERERISKNILSHFIFLLSTFISKTTHNLTPDPSFWSPPLPRRCFTEHVNGKMSIERWLMTQCTNTQRFVQKEIGYLRIYTSIGLWVFMCARLLRLSTDIFYSCSPWSFQCSKNLVCFVTITSTFHLLKVISIICD